MVAKYEELNKNGTKNKTLLHNSLVDAIAAKGALNQ